MLGRETCELGNTSGNEDELGWEISDPDPNFNPNLKINPSPNINSEPTARGGKEGSRCSLCNTRVTFIM